MEAITLQESRRLIALEKTIEAGKKAFVEVGTALAEIRDSKLYRVDYDTFEEYCHKKWGWKKAHAYRLMDAADFVKTSPIGDKITTESQARELAKVAPEKREEVVKQAAKNGKVTAKSIREAAEPKKPLWLGYVNRWGSLRVKPHDMDLQLDCMNSPSCFKVIAGIEAENQEEAEYIAKRRLAAGEVIITHAGNRDTQPTDAKPAKVVEVQPIEEASADAHEDVVPEKTMLDATIEDIRAIADDLAYPSGEHPDYTDISNRLLLAAKAVRQIAKEAK